MSELSQVLAAIDERSGRGEPMALATIVATRGSTYRRAGARLLIPAEGEPIGNISGGCLEGDVAAVGRSVLAEGRPRTVLFDLTAEGEEVWGYGLGCNGSIELLVEPAGGAVETARALRLAVEEERPCVLVAVIGSDRPDVPVGRRLLVTPEAATGSISPDADAAATRVARCVLARGEEATSVEELRLGEAGIRLFVEPVWPPLRLIVCGAGHDAIPLVRAASALGWRIVVADPRRRLLSHQRFPEASGFLDADPAQAANAMSPDPRTAVVVMTHNYLRDSEYLAAFLGTPAFYVGQLGPRRRTDQLLEEIERQGVTIDDEDRSKLHAPAGLDVGAEEPEEIAAAIVGEVLAAHRRRRGGPLREQPGPIHRRDGG